MDRKALQERLHQQIPLSQFMQVEVLQADDQRIGLQCALEPNHNHLGTAFGGSLTCLMILAAYCQIFRIVNQTGHVVVKSSSTEFLLPVEEKLYATCEAPNAQALSQFLKIYNKKGRARLTLQSQIVLADGRIACKMNSEFVGID
jgi:thioesterase domain-containing protein